MFLTIQDLCFDYHSKDKNTSRPPILQNISFSINQNERIALIGSNGSGKTTLLFLIAGCLTPNNGIITLLNEPLTGNPKKAGQHIGLLFQNPEVQLLLPSVYEELSFALKTKGLQKNQINQAVNEIAACFDCSHLLDKPPQSLSIGEKQKVALTTLLTLEPKLLLLDEPTASLDPRARKKLIKLLQQINTTLLVATHDLDLALDIATRVLIINNGEIVADGMPKHTLKDKALLEKNSLELPLTLQRQ